MYLYKFDDSELIKGIILGSIDRMLRIRVRCWGTSWNSSSARFPTTSSAAPHSPQAYLYPLAQFSQEHSSVFDPAALATSYRAERSRPWFSRPRCLDPSWSAHIFLPWISSEFYPRKLVCLWSWLPLWIGSRWSRRVWFWSSGFPCTLWQV